jgi:uncharacterized membrane protein YfcA
MEAVYGFLIALVVGMTGAGGGTLAVPVLVLAFGVPTTEAVAASLAFSTVIKLLATPVYLLRRQFCAATLARLLAGGVPGVLAGSLLLNKLNANGAESAISTIVGGTIAVFAIGSLWRLRQPHTACGADRSRWLPCIALPIGLEVGFSSAGAGALGGVALLSLTPLSASAIVGTDLLFGLGLSMAGSGLHLAMGTINGEVVARLLAGGVAGALAGPWVGTRIPTRAMRAALSGVLCVVGVHLFWRGFANLVNR